MARKFKTVDYEKSLQQTVTLAECLPPDHLARFVVAIIALLDLSAIYAHYAALGGEAFAPEILLGLLFYGYATGVFSSRRLETATYESIPFRFIAGGLHPDHDTIANFRKTFLPEIKALFVQVLVIAQEAGVLQLGNISLDGSKIHADASKSHAVSYKRLGEIEAYLQQEVEELCALSEQPDAPDLPTGLNIAAEIAWRQERRVNLAEAKRVLEERARERYAAERAEYEAKVREREQQAQETGHRPRGRAPVPPTAGPRDNDQYNFTDPESRIMKNSNNAGFDQHYNAQAAVDQASMLIVAQTLSNHPVDTAEALPTLRAVPTVLGPPPAAAMDRNYFSPANIQGLEALGIAPYIATGREPHHRSWRAFFADTPAPPLGNGAWSAWPST
jgi:transposase